MLFRFVRSRKVKVKGTKVNIIFIRHVVQHMLNGVYGHVTLREVLHEKMHQHFGPTIHYSYTLLTEALY